MHAEAAEGWYGLGDFNSALAELDQVSASAQKHPVVLMVRCEILEGQKRWTEVLPLAESLWKKRPDLPDTWIKRSFALHELKRTQEAYAHLLPAAKLFPKQWLVAYNLACYACQLGELDEAKKHLKKAIKLGGKAEGVRQEALHDPDLHPIRELIAKI